MNLSLWISLAASTFNVPQGMLSAICFVESSHRSGIVVKHDGGSPSHGACQVKESTARLMGYTGSDKALKSDENSTYYAAKYLRYQLDRYNGDTLKAIAAYNAGTYKADKQGYARNRRYVKKVFAAWAEGR